MLCGHLEAISEKAAAYGPFAVVLSPYAGPLKPTSVSLHPPGLLHAAAGAAICCVPITTRACSQPALLPERGRGTAIRGGCRGTQFGTVDKTQKGCYGATVTRESPTKTRTHFSSKPCRACRMTSNISTLRCLQDCTGRGWLFLLFYFELSFRACFFYADASW